MIPFKKIVCPTDFSDPSYEGVKVANEIAVHFSAEVILVNVIPPMTYYPPPAPSIAQGFDVTKYQKEMIPHAKKSLSAVAGELISKEIKTREVVLEGNPAESIVALAESKNADAIVIATHGFTGWRRFIFGSVAEKVVRIAPCSVLTIPAPGKDE